jgi:hypothetical protein
MAGELVAMVGILVPIFAIVMGVLLAILAVRWRYKKEIEKQKTIRDAIEKGVELPKELFEDRRSRESTPQIVLRNGLVLTFLGISLSITLGVFINYLHAVWGLIPLFIGIALLIYYFIIKKES